MTETNTWNPGQYNKFEKERTQPFYDLLALVIPHPDMNIIDLGCGTGKLTQILHSNLEAKTTVGIDSSETMLKNAPRGISGLTFQLKNILDFRSKEKINLIFSNAALQWLPNHQNLFKDLREILSKSGQMAIQVPANFDSPTHLIAKRLALESPFCNYLDESKDPKVLNVEEYAKIFYELGANRQIVRLQIYGHILESTQSAIEWVKGSLLTYYESYLPVALFDEFLQRYTRQIHEHFGNQKPLFYPFKRLLLWAEF